MSSEIAEVFEVLLYGEGFWLGFIIIMAFSIAISYRFKYTGILFEVILFLLSIEYLNELSDGNELWGVILCYVGMILIATNLYRDVKKDT